jgi:hypothetical protein
MATALSADWPNRMVAQYPAPPAAACPLIFSPGLRLYTTTLVPGHNSLANYDYSSHQSNTVNSVRKQLVIRLRLRYGIGLRRGMPHYLALTNRG